VSLPLSEIVYLYTRGEKKSPGTLVFCLSHFKILNKEPIYSFTITNLIRKFQSMWIIILVFFFIKEKEIKQKHISSTMVVGGGCGGKNTKKLTGNGCGALTN